ncbi:hypothetical protein BRAS3843_770027 [Bradyrhizobium sp. STM 3843]|uniref:hypothetical protein n=1 Tax=Bradyrhizobium sp. STM 3843 TaxID=551947 RepID=UPI0002404A26|nr:hypothetical protein [Bradyrhizobium sp. STM 3843]CCE11729.1 hypothetical protein BRAS3843_770027 [Bradyrhizobium sp. STM 3843]
MSWSYSDIVNYQRERLEQERAESLAMLESGRLNEDAALVNTASDALLRIDRDAAQVQRYAANLARQEQQQQYAAASNKFGLTRSEQEIAEAAIPDRDDVRLTKEQKHEAYYLNKQKLARMRASGEYDDSQGKVFRS